MRSGSPERDGGDGQFLPDAEHAQARPAGIAPLGRRDEQQQAWHLVGCVVVDSSPAYRAGLCAALRAAHLSVIEAEELRELHAHLGWSITVVVHAMASATATPPARPTQDVVLVTVGLLPNSETASYVEALRSGWDAVVFRDAAVDEIVDVVREAVAHRVVLPDAVAHDLARHVQFLQVLEREHAEWLRFLAAGGTVAALAAQHAYSEREMHRRLHALYQRLGVSNKVEALLVATRLGVL